MTNEQWGRYIQREMRALLRDGDTITYFSTRTDNKITRQIEAVDTAALSIQTTWSSTGYWFVTKIRQTTKARFWYKHKKTKFGSANSIGNDTADVKNQMASNIKIYQMKTIFLICIFNLLLLL